MNKQPQSRHIRSATAYKASKPSNTYIMENANPGSAQVTATLTEKFILLKLPKNEGDITFIRGMKYAKWDKAGFCWVISRNNGNIEFIKNYFRERLQWIESHTLDPTFVHPSKKIEVSDNTLLIVKYNNGRLRLIFRYNKPLINLIKLQPFHQWDAQNGWWTIPHTEKIMKSLVDFCGTFGWQYKFVEDLNSLNRKARINPADILNYRNVPDAYLEKLSVIRYSPSTVRTYCDCLKNLLTITTPRI